MSHVKGYTKQTASGKTVFVREHLKNIIPKYGEHDKGYEGPVHGEHGGKPAIEYLVSTTNRYNPDKKMNWRLQQHPEDEYSGKVKEYEKMKSDLNLGIITPRRILGAGQYSKKHAMAWIDEQLEQANKDLTEVTAKKIPRYKGELPVEKKTPESKAKPEKKEVQHRITKENADHLFGKDRPKPTASERGMMRHKEKSSVFKKSHVKEHARKTASGKIVMVKEHEDMRHAAGKDHKKLEDAKMAIGRVAYLCSELKGASSDFRFKTKLRESAKAIAKVKPTSYDDVNKVVESFKSFLNSSPSKEEAAKFFTEHNVQKMNETYFDKLKQFNG